MNKKHYDYVQPILEWAEEKGIFENGRLTKQLMKSAEECLELQTAIESYANGNKEALVEIKDAIGDVYVTLVISTEMAELKDNTWLIFRSSNHLYTGGLNFDYLTCISEVQYMNYRVFRNLTSTYKVNANILIEQYIDLLNVIAMYHGLELVECIDFAYNTISKRKGQMIDGSFVKEK